MVFLSFMNQIAQPTGTPFATKILVTRPTCIYMGTNVHAILHVMVKRQNKIMKICD